MEGAKILLIEDEKKIARFLELELNHEGYEVHCESNGREGLRKRKQKNTTFFCLI